MRNRAVSDMIGFVLVFGLIVSTVGVVYVGGFAALQDARDYQRFSNTERAFDVMDANIEDVAVRGAPRRNTELLLSDATLALGAPVTFNVTDGANNSYPTTFRPILYRGSNGNELVYSNGAVFRQYDDAAVMFDEPRFASGDRTFIPYVITPNQTADVSTAGTRRLLVRTIETGREVRTFDEPNLMLNVTSPRAAAWGRYFETELGLSCTDADAGVQGRVSCDLNTDEVYVQAVAVDVVFA